jgi:DNA-binding response OmpR family regulator
MTDIGTKRVLLVDDDVRSTHIMGAVLRRNGFAVQVESNSRKAIDAALSFKPHLILLDVAMPFKDGGILASELRDCTLTAATPISFVTGIVTKDELGQMVGKQGGADYLAKPVSPTLLLSHVRRKTDG